MGAMARIFVTRELPGPALARLKEAHDTTVWPGQLPPSYEELRDHVAGAAGLLSRTVQALSIPGCRLRREPGA